MASHIGERYARALLEVTEERKETDKAAAQLGALGQAIESAQDLAQVLHDPRFKDERLAVFEALGQKLGASNTVSSLLRTLAAAERLHELPDVAAAFSRLADEQSGRVRATVSSAVALDDGDKKGVQAALESSTGKQVVIEFTTDPSLLGGVVVKMQDLVWDGSVRTQLERMRASLQAS